MATWRHRRPSVVGAVARVEADRPTRDRRHPVGAPAIRPSKALTGPARPVVSVLSDMIAPTPGTPIPRRPRRAANGVPGGVSARPRSGRTSRWRRAAGLGLTTTRRSDPELRPVGGRASGGSRRHRTRRDDPELRPPHRRPSCPLGSLHVSRRLGCRRRTSPTTTGENPCEPGCPSARPAPALVPGTWPRTGTPRSATTARRSGRRRTGSTTTWTRASGPPRSRASRCWSSSAASRARRARSSTTTWPAATRSSATSWTSSSASASSRPTRST